MTPNGFVDSLPPREKQAVQYHMSGLLTKDIGRRMGIDSKTVTSMLIRVRQKAETYGLAFRPRLVFYKFED